MSQATQSLFVQVGLIVDPGGSKDISGADDDVSSCCSFSSLSREILARLLEHGSSALGAAGAEVAIIIISCFEHDVIGCPWAPVVVTAPLDVEGSAAVEEEASMPHGQLGQVTSNKRIHPQG